LNKKIKLIVPLVLVSTLCMLVGPASAKPSVIEILDPPNSWTATGTGFVYKNGILKHGPATIYVDVTLTIVPGGVYPNVIGLTFPSFAEPGAWGFWWKITQTSVLPNGNIMLYAVPLPIDVHGDKLFSAGPGPINVVVLPPLAGFGERQYVTAFGLGAYFNGWTVP
jgi:hypothetical protein